MFHAWHVCPCITDPPDSSRCCSINRLSNLRKVFVYMYSASQSMDLCVESITLTHSCAARAPRECLGLARGRLPLPRIFAECACPRTLTASPVPLTQHIMELSKKMLVQFFKRKTFKSNFTTTII